MPNSRRAGQQDTPDPQPSEIKEFQLFKRDLQELMQVGKVKTMAAFLFALGSGSARVASADLPALLSPRRRLDLFDYGPGCGRLPA